MVPQLHRSHETNKFVETLRSVMTRLLVMSALIVGLLGSVTLNAQVTIDVVSPIRAFDLDGARAVPMNVQNMTLDLTIDPAKKETVGRATIQFQSPEAGRPYFLLKGIIQSVQLNGQLIGVQPSENPGDETVNVLSSAVPPGINQTLQIDYLITVDAISYREGGVGFVTAMADISDGNFFEEYAPASYEDDQLKLILNASLVGTDKPHQIFTNGTVTQPNPTSWSIEFPPYFTTSSFYVHLTDTDFEVRRSTYPGVEKPIPITVYSASARAADEAIAALPELFSELEGDYGPYLHGSFTAFISGSGGMEHGGATITSLAALGHELTHSWFGRGVMPSGGSSGWIDEAIATWRDRDYPRSGTVEDLDPANIGNLSPFERFTPFAAYDQGGDLLTVMDNLFAGNLGGLKSVLRDFFSTWKTRLVSTEDFQNFLQSRTATNLDPIFETAVLGRNTAGTVGTTPPAEPGQVGVPPAGTLHPPSLTPEEIRDLR